MNLHQNYLFNFLTFIRKMFLLILHQIFLIFEKFVSFGTHCLGLTILKNFLGTVWRLQCLKFNVCLCPLRFFLIRNLNTSEFLILISACREFQYIASCLFNFKNSLGRGKFEDGYLA
jgi:hypothetical protein